MKDGGAAFPCHPSLEPDGFTPSNSSGMTLRDWFAGQVLAGFMACPGVRGSAGEIAIYSYATADAMIAAREKGSK